MAFARPIDRPGAGHGTGARSAAAWAALVEDERRKVAVLWNAFEEAETRVRELEVLVERQRVAASLARLAPPESPPGAGPSSRAKVPVRGTLRPRPRYPGDLCRVADLPGITPAEAEALRTSGVNLGDEFLHVDLDALARAAGISRERLQRWRDMCELMGIRGIGPTWAERLVDAGVGSISALGAMEPARLKDVLVQSYQAKGGKAQGRALLERTLPARCKALVAGAKKAERSR